MSFVFFFFQAEDGIRDVAVTGVQTCALPISSGFRFEPADERAGRELAAYVQRSSAAGIRLRPSKQRTSAELGSRLCRSSALGRQRRSDWEQRSVAVFSA